MKRLSRVERANKELLRYRDMLMESPREFNARGLAHAMLKCVFAGASVKLLRKVLGSSDLEVTKSAIYVASEIGGNAITVVDWVEPHVLSPDVRVAFAAAECLASVAGEDNKGRMLMIGCLFGSGEDVLIERASELLRVASGSQLEDARKRLEREYMMSGSNMEVMKGVFSSSGRYACGTDSHSGQDWFRVVEAAQALRTVVSSSRPRSQPSQFEP